MVEIKEVKVEQVSFLRELAITTLYETFYTEEKAKNLKDYVHEAYDIDVLVDSLQDEYSHTFFIYCKQEIAGYLKVNVHTSQSEPMGDDGFEIQRIYILKKFKGLGLERILMDVSISLAKFYKKSFVWLGVWEHNYAAQAFYKTFGFDKVSEHDFAMGDLVETDWILKKEI
ncbi:hypothetical protein A4S06_02020 [Erysipelotrichaceae bacterium MTC7]|nr:hypothetical protein A4S06_02020 [Erysipelotrichaceae bacterium MTC7]